ncbi:MAG: AraC family transcriptional regulator [Clostridia bacterium]|nr:AraC family transcriptional regulator [Clostridia bacterium]
MTVSEIAKELNLKFFTCEDLAAQKEAKGCYIGDLLSFAMSKVEMNNIWITIQTNVNIVAVATLAEASCILLTDGCVPDKLTIERAEEQEMIILGGDLTAYEAASKLSQLGI